MNAKTRVNILIILAIFLVSLVYYYALSSKIWTWLYVTGDSGDWMMFANWWITPQPMGSPLFISIIRLLGWLFPGADVYQLLTFSLAVLPGAVLAVLTYFIGKELTRSWKLGLVATVVLLGMSVVLTQATVLEEYMLTAVFVAGSFLAYLKNRLYLSVALLGLGAAVHAIVVVIAVLWLAVEWRRLLWKPLIRLASLFIVLGILPYLLILFLMAADNPPLMAGGLSWESLNVYLGNLYLTGNLSLSQAPQRILDVILLLVTTLGLACYPLIVGFRAQRTNRETVALMVIGCILWFWFSNIFFSTFKFMVIAAPILAGYAAYGLTRLPRWQTTLVIASSIVLILVNGLVYNADRLARQDPVAVNLYEAIMDLPDESVMLTPRGGSYGFVLYYALSEGKNLTPILLKKGNVNYETGEIKIDRGYLDFIDWFQRNYEYTSTDCFAVLQEALDKGKEVYYVSLLDDTTPWAALTFQDTGIEGLSRITEVKIPSWDLWMLNQGSSENEKQ